MPARRARGLSNAEVAAELVIAEETVKTHVSTAVLIITPMLSVPRILDIVDQLRTGTETPGLAIEIIAISIFKPWDRTRWGHR